MAVSSGSIRALQIAAGGGAILTNSGSTNMTVTSLCVSNLDTAVQRSFTLWLCPTSTATPTTGADGMIHQNYKVDPSDGTNAPESLTSLLGLVVPPAYKIFVTPSTASVLSFFGGYVVE